MVRIALLAIAAFTLFAVAGAQRQAEAGALPSNVMGDADCSSQVNARDALWDLLYQSDRLINGLACQTNGNVICGDGINMDDVIALLNYSAGLTQDVPSGCPPIGVDAVHSTVDKGTDTIQGTFSFNLDDGTQVGSGGDLFWEIESDVPLVTRLHASGGIARIESFLAFSNISYAQIIGAEWGTGPIEVADLHVGDIFAVRTSEGNYSKIQIASLAHDLEIQWVTFSPDPPAP
jgi:hypothetical protein